MLLTIPLTSAESGAPFTAVSVPTDFTEACQGVSCAVMVATVCTWLAKPFRNFAMKTERMKPQPNTSVKITAIISSMMIIRFAALLDWFIVRLLSWNHPAAFHSHILPVPPAPAQRLVECRRV